MAKKLEEIDCPQEEESKSKKKSYKPAPKKEIPSVVEKITALKVQGSSVQEIATQLGYEPDKISKLLGERIKLGSSEQILQENLEIISKLIPLAEESYKEFPNYRNAQAVTGFIECTRTLVEQLQILSDKESLYMNLIQRILQPMLRQLLKEVVIELQQLNRVEEISRDSLNAELTKVSRNVALKYKDVYRNVVDELGSTLGVSIDAKTRVMSTLFSNVEE